MNSRTLTVAVGDYDHTRDLVNGTVALAGVDVIAIPRPEEIFARALEGEFAASEMSLAVLSNLISRGDDRFVATPVFPARSFRHAAIYTQTEGPERPEDLAGTRIGIPVWGQTAGVVVRGLLAHQYGVDLTSVTWIRAGVDEPGRPEPVEFDAGPFRVESRPQRSLDELLLAGEVDAVISARPPASVKRGDLRVRRMFAHPELAERVYFQETGIFPIMHALVVRRSVLEDRPNLPIELTEAFTAAKDRSLRRAAEATVPSYPLPWAAVHVREARELFGDDFWPYGMDANRLTLTRFLQDAFEQRITARRLELGEIFTNDALVATPEMN